MKHNGHLGGAYSLLFAIRLKSLLLFLDTNNESQLELKNTFL